MIDKKIVARFAMRETIGAAFIGVVLFWAAGTMQWWAAWAMIVVSLLWSTGTAIVILRLSPDLLAERLGPQEGAKKWDTTIMSIIGVLALVRLIVAGLDHRNNWTSNLGLPAQLIGLAVVVLGYALVVWATGSNAYFSQIVRIQNERNHAVATRGPYRIVRHPAYLGTILVEFGAPILLSSWWALIPGIVTAVLYVVRTALEDRTLLTEMDGYQEFAAQTKYRIFPGIW